MPDEVPPPVPSLPPPSPPLPPPHSREIVWCIGHAAACLSGGLLCGGIALLDHKVRDAFLLPSSFLLPLLNGLVAAYFWRKLNPTVGMVALQTLLLTFLDIAGATIFLREGVICLLMAFPLLYLLVFSGALLGRILFKNNPSHLQISVLPLLALFALSEPFTRGVDPLAVVTDEILIHAPPARVWPQVTSFPPIPEPPRFWLFKLGLPCPMATTSGGNYVGADRRCIFSQNAVFKETVAGLIPERELTFNIDEVPPDPELLGHLSPQRGQFLLRDNHDGTTTLVGSTWYRLHVRPLWYFDWWTQHVFRAVHMRVMEDVKRRAEA